jgi:hypothetical protein
MNLHEEKRLLNKLISSTWFWFNTASLRDSKVRSQKMISVFLTEFLCLYLFFFLAFQVHVFSFKYFYCSPMRCLIMSHFFLSLWQYEKVDSWFFLQLTENDKESENDCPQSDPKDRVHEVSADNRQDDVRPRIPRVQVGELIRAHAHWILNLTL